MKNKLSRKYKEIVDLALRVLNSMEIQELAKEERSSYRKGFYRSSYYFLIDDRNIRKFIELAESRLIPSLAKIDLRLGKILPPHGFNLIQCWIKTYLRHAARSSTSLKTLSRKYARFFVEDAVREHVTSREIIPLYRFSSDREFSFSVMSNEGKLRFCFLKHDHRRHARALGFHFFPDPTDLHDDMVSQLPYNWALVVEKDIPRIKSFLGDENKSKTGSHRILTALRLFKDQEFEFVNSYLSWNTFYMAGTSYMSRGSTYALPHGEKYQISEEKIKAFRRFYKRFMRYLPLDDTLPPRIHMAIRYFESSSPKPLHERFMDLSIALDALFGIQWDSTYRLPIRIAMFLRGHDKKTLSFLAEVKKLWGSRNNLAHGKVNVKNKDYWRKLSIKTPELRKVVWESINKHLKLFSAVGHDVKQYNKIVEKHFEDIFVIDHSEPLSKKLARYK